MGEYLHRWAGVDHERVYPRFLFSHVDPVTVPFQKPWLSYAGQLAKLQARGLAVADPSEAERFLSHVNYYRFSGYCLAFEGAGRHAFVPGTTFEQVRAAYEFDFRLRDLLSEALEVIEVDFRTAVAHHFGGRSCRSARCPG